MKINKILLIIILMQTALQARSQSPVEPLYRGDNTIENRYSKDLDHDLDKFVGTWRYANNDTILIIRLRLKPMHHIVSDVVGNSFRDILVGEYKCTVNGIEIANSLNRLNQNFANRYDYTISCGIITNACRICPQNKREVNGKFIEQDRKHIRNGSVQIRHVNQGTQEFIRFDFYSSGIESEYAGDPSSPWANKFNYGTYLMEKLP